MGNKLFQEAREFVEQAVVSKDQRAIETAKNAISSAYANSTNAERAQLMGMQESIDKLS